MPQDIVPQLLQKRWMHSREEDTAAETVFRPASYSFPPARGRTGFELRPDQSLVEIGIGPTDRVEESPGKWQLEHGNQLLLYSESSPEPTQAMQVVSVDEDRLVIKK
jgi:hypothetical protein